MKKQKLNLIFLMLFSIIATDQIIAQNRVERPLQIHLNGSGLFLKSFGNKLADSEIDQLEVKNWRLPGLSIGYHINKRLYVGYSFQPNRNLILDEPWTFGTKENDGNLILDHNTGVFNSLEARVFPFGIDLYGTIFLIHTSKADYDMQLIRTNDELMIAETKYDTDIDANWNFKSLSTVGLGLGYNYVHRSGISFDLGLGIPIPISDPLYQNIKINSAQGISINEIDVESAKRKIENELFYFPIQLHVNAGYNFN